VPVENLALLRDLDGDLHAPLSDVPLDRLELLGWEVREDLIGLGMVAVDHAHG
jgi:hypothetical protein